MPRPPVVPLAAITLFLLPFRAKAQSTCPTSTLQGSSATFSASLICSVPQVYGSGGMVGTDNGGPLDPTSHHAVHFQASALNSFGPLNSEIGVQLSQLPIAAPVAGILFTGGVVVATESYGPVLTDRAETLRAHTAFIGISYQHFEFDKIDGVNLRSLGVVLTHEPEPTICTTFPAIPCVNGEPTFTNDIIGTTTGVDLKMHQLTLVGSYALTNRVEISLALPISNMRMAVQSLATIYSFEPPPLNHRFVQASNDARETYIDSSDARFGSAEASTGVGDLTIRGKFKPWQSADEKSALAMGLDLRVPTGDPYNFLGAGTWGVRPFVVWSRTGLVSPHATIGFQGNGSSVLAGNVTSQPVTKAKLPDIFSYYAGADISLGHVGSVTTDFIGQSLLSASKLAQTTYVDYNGASHPNITSSTETVNEFSISLGGKVKTYQNVLLTANVLFRVNDGGLHSKPVPLVGLSYTF